MAAIIGDSKTKLLRWAHPLGFAHYLRQIGTPVDNFFSRHRLPSMCEDPEVFVPLRSAWSFWDQLAAREDPLLGWHVGRHYGADLLGKGLLNKLVGAPTLNQALHQFVALVGAEASHLKLGVYERRDDVLFYTHYPDLKGFPGYEISQAYQIEVYLAFVRHFAGPNWQSHEIGIERPNDPPGLLERFHDTRIVSGRRIGYVAIPRTCLHLKAPIPSSSKAAQGTLIRADKLDFTDALRMLLVAYLSDGYPSAQFSAKLMDTSVRTLHRRLADQGLRYAALVDEVRYDRAKHLLAETDATVAEVSGVVGFDDPTHFARMFRRVGGIAPREFRNSLHR